MAKKIPLPKVKSKKLGLSDKIWAGIAGLSPFTGRAALHQSMTSQTAAGRAAQAAQLKRLAKYGKWGSRLARFSGLMNPYTAVPIAATYLARHAVSNALEPYKNQDVENTSPWWTMGLMDNRGISPEGNLRLSQERMAREELAAANRAKREGTWLGKLDERMLNQLRSAGMNEGGIARLL